jgi:inner membrane protein
MARMTWWWWTLVGLGLLLVEIVTPGGLFALFFGAGALAVGALVAVGLGGPAWFQWLLFCATGCARGSTRRAGRWTR